jgi:hypothetical protein
MNLQVVGNVIKNCSAEGIFLYTTDAGKTLSMQTIGNQVSESGRVAITEVGDGIFDTHYLFNDH